MMFDWTPGATRIASQLVREYHIEPYKARQMVMDGWRPTEEFIVGYNHVVDERMRPESLVTVDDFNTRKLRVATGEHMEQFAEKRSESGQMGWWGPFSHTVHKTWSFRVARPLDDKRVVGDNYLHDH